MSLINLIRKAVAKTNDGSLFEGITRVSKDHGDLYIWRAGRLMMHIRYNSPMSVAPPVLMEFDIVGQAECKAGNSILTELGVEKTSFMYSRPGVLCLTPNRVDDKETFTSWQKDKALKDT